VDAFNADAISVVPAQGTVGASGDLAPLSHLALGMMGEGTMWDGRTGEIKPANEVLKSRNLEPIVLEAKEGLALINGTQMMAALGAEAVHQARNVALCADITAALTVEVLKGTPRAFHPSIHSVRPHHGQQTVAARLRTLLSPTSELFKSHEHVGRVQDAYSLRCAPQVIFPPCPHLHFSDDSCV
jgi:histidine ammonia-lyase